MCAMNFDQARFNMIEQQIRPWEVLDQRILDLLAEVPREDFVPEGYRSLAFADTNIPLGYGEVMMAPKVEARALQALNIRRSDRVWEIGTGSGYLTACLARLSQWVRSVDIHKDFVQRAERMLRNHGITNVQFEVGDALAIPPKTERFDVIAVTGSMPLYPEDLQELLTVQGRMFVIVGKSPAMEALVVTRVGSQEWMQDSLFETDLPPLVNAPHPSPFKF